MNVQFREFSRAFGRRFVQSFAPEKYASKTGTLLSLVDGRSAYSESHPAYKAADGAARALLCAILSSDRLTDDLLDVLARGASLYGLEVDPGSADSTLQRLAYDAAEIVVTDRANDEMQAAVIAAGMVP